MRVLHALAERVNPGDSVRLGYPWYRGASGKVASVGGDTIGVIFDCREDGAVIRVPIHDLVICREVTRLSDGCEFRSGVYIERNKKIELIPSC